MKTKKVGVVHGRFQPIHLGHMEYILAAKARCDYLIVGITNPDPTLTADHQSNLARSSTKSNPFTYYERFLMIKGALLEAGVRREDFDIVSFPINFPQLILNYVPSDAIFFTTIYERWNRVKVEILKSLGLKVEILWEKDMSDRFTIGDKIRNLIACGQKWDHLVPKAAANVIREFDLEKKLKSRK